MACKDLGQHLNPMHILYPFNKETLGHRFWDCIAQRIWQWTLQILFELNNAQHYPFHDFDWQNGIFGHGIWKKYKTWFGIWHLLRGIAMWTIWIEHNDMVSNHEQ
jgi:hypothetical protein